MDVYRRSIGWIVATAVGYVLGGIALHSPGASGVGTAYLDVNGSAAGFGAILGAIVGAVTGVLQLFALGVRSWRPVAASVVAVASAHALADGAPGAWSVAVVAAVSGIAAALAFSWAFRIGSWRWILAASFAWWAGWNLGVTGAGALGLSNGSSADVWAREHAVIALILGLLWGGVTSPLGRRIWATRPTSPRDRP